MAGGISITTDFLWRGALLATVPALLVALLARWLPARPATRHTLWLVALAWFAAAPVLPPFPMSFGKGPPIEVKVAEVPATANSANPPTTGARTKSIALYPLARARHERGRRSTLESPELLSPDQPSFQDRASPRPDQDGNVEVRIAPASPGANSLGAVVAGVWTAATDEIGRWWGQCLTGLWAFRDAAASLPSIPWYIWLTGILAIVFARALACWRFVHYLNRSELAPYFIRLQVWACARQMGLRHAPETRMIDGGCSPMICGLGRRCLLLPRELWSQLDDQAREAIIYHELAHLHRRDHWIRGVEGLMSALYWWHPVIWWLRIKLHEEAEVCCDAWVTWLMPRSRRAYAEALLQTHQYIQLNRSAVPSVGLGAASVRAKTFARRITMVMKANGKPGISAAGVSTIAALMVAAWCATPVWSCPKDGEKCEMKPVKHRPLAVTEPISPTPAVVAVECPDQPAPPAEPTPPPGEGGMLSVLGAVPGLVQPLLGVTNEDSGPRNSGFPRKSREDLDARLERLERQLEELSAKLRGSHPMMRPMISGHVIPAAPPSPRIGKIPGTPAPSALGGAVNMLTPSVRSAPLAAVAASAHMDDGEKIWRSYKLSDGKREALISLMARNDVPVLIRDAGDKIDVQATEEGHEIFSAFVRLIDPGAGGEIRQRTPRAASDPFPGIRGAAAAERRAAEAARHAAEGARHAAEGRRHAEERMKTRIKGKLKRPSANMHEEHIARMEETHDEVSDRVGELNDRIAEIKERAQELAGEAKSRAMDEARKLKDEARMMAQQARELARQIKESSRELADLQRRGEVDAEDNEDAEDDSDEADEAPQAQNWYQKGYQLHTEGKYDQAIECFQKSAETGERKADSIYNIACGYSLKGDKDKAIEWLRRAWEAGYRDVNHMNQDSDLDNIRDDARFKKLTKRVDRDAVDDEDDESR